jgi:hypothetical protein
VVSNSPLRTSETARSLLDEDGAAWEAMGSASQSAAYAQIDRGILSRRVGMAKVVVGEAAGRRVSAVVDAESVAASTPAGSTVGDEGDEELSIVTSQTDETGTDHEEEVVEKVVSVSHVLTNIIVLQEFILELAALIQVRAAMFDEVKFM